MSLPPFSLALLGPPRFRGPHGTPPSASPHRIAVLAVLAAAGDAGIPRDRLATLVWPRASAARALRDLQLTLDALRLEAQLELAIGGDPLRLDRAAVATDLAVFDRAVALGRHDDALAAYAGPLLEGFTLPSSPAFGAWLAEERERRARQAIAAADALVVELEAAGRDATPARERAAELRTQLAFIAAAPPPTGRPALRRLWPWVAAAGVLAAAFGAAAFRPPVKFASGEYIVVGEFANLTGDTLLSHVVTTAFRTSLAQSSHVTPLPRPRVVAALRRMRRPDTTTLATPELAREVAVREHASLVVNGRIARLAGELELRTDVVDAATGEVLRTRTRRAVDRDRLLAAIDDLARDLRRDLGEARASVRGSVPLPAVTTSSLEALRLYGDAMRLEDENRMDEAADRLQAAIRLDSSFARARAAYGGFLTYVNRPREAEPHFEAALRLASSLPLAESEPIRAQVQRARGDDEAAIRTLRGYLARYPGDAEAWRSLASSLRRASRAQEALAAYDSAARRMPLDANDRVDIAAIWLRLSDGPPPSPAAMDSARRAYERAFVLDSALLTYVYMNHQYGMTLVHAGEADSARAVFGRMLSRDPNDRARGQRSLGFLEAWEGRWRSAARWFADASRTSVEQQQWTSAARSSALAGNVLALAGDTAAARAHLRTAAQYARAHDVDVRFARFAAVGMALAGDREGLASLVAWMRTAALPDSPPMAAAVSQAAGLLLQMDPRTAAAGRDSVLASLAVDSTSYPQALAALARSRAGDWAAAAPAWARIGAGFTFGSEEQFLAQAAPWFRGRALEARGDRAGAREAYRAFVESFPPVTPEAQLPDLVRDARARMVRLAGTTPATAPAPVGER